MVDSLNAKIIELQGSVARLLKEKSTQAQGGETKKAMVDFRAYLSSSPNVVVRYFYSQSIP